MAKINWKSRFISKSAQFSNKKYDLISHKINLSNVCQLQKLSITSQTFQKQNSVGVQH